ncbi:winged helix-turn-helix transcriptional regulator [Candidatus Uhrbacteria bacterium]|nr:winged helix-turn-helix transcriptional regulator [Candidatus Uhrbacteria bacterium]
MTTERILKALANQRRLTILQKLKDRELSVAEIAASIKLSFRSTSKHLHVLARADILDRRQKSLTVFYRISHAPHPIVHTTLAIL